MPACRQVLKSVASAYRKRKGEVIQSAEQLPQQLQIQSTALPKPEALNRLTLDEAFTALEQQYDRTHGGFGGAPKFPQPMILEYLLRVYQRTRYPASLSMTRHTLDRMARGRSEERRVGKEGRS